MTPKYIGLGQFPSVPPFSLLGHSFQFNGENLLALFYCTLTDAACSP